MREDDLIRLRHMLGAANEAKDFLDSRSRVDLDKNRMLSLATLKSIEIIGESASRVSDELRDSLPEIPWQNIIAMRNRLIHAYFDIDLDRVWGTVKEDLPPLIKALKKAIAS